MTYIFHNDQPVAEVGEEWLLRLRECAATAPQRRSRLCLHHRPDDALHEMVICFHHSTLVRPHRHIGKSESFHVIDGELDVLLFDNDGRPTRRVSLGGPGSGRMILYRLSSPDWHSVIVRSEYAAIHEVTNGPFDPTPSDFPSWAPAEDTELAAFLAAADRQLGGRRERS